MKRIILVVFLLILIPSVFYYFRYENIISPLGSKLLEKPLEKYTFENLRKAQFKPSAITLGRIVKDEKDYISQMFYYTVDNNPSTHSTSRSTVSSDRIGSGQAGSGLKRKVSGLANVPKKPGNYPVIVMFRGFVPQEIYAPGVGTQHGGEVLAQNGFITLAPDFLGYGESDNPSQNSIEERFQTYTTALALFSSVQNLNSGLSASYSGTITADTNKIGVWAHSNGGHIALSVMAISGKKYPTVLWAPVSKPFPYSILYYMDEFDDHGKALRRVVADFEKDYDVEKYSPTNYYSWIQAPIQLHQGDADDAVPIRWSDQLNEILKKQGHDIMYFTYPGADHNMSVGWSTAIQRSIGFYKEHFR